MKRNRIAGILVAVFGVLVAVLPQTLLPICPKMGGMVMRCNHTASVELLIGIITVIIGVLLIAIKDKIKRIYFSISGAVSGIFTVIAPILVGVCHNEQMGCNAVAKPVLILLGIILFFISLISLLIEIKFSEDLD